MLSLLVVGVEEEPDAHILELNHYSRYTTLGHGTDKKIQAVVGLNRTPPVGEIPLHVAFEEKTSRQLKQEEHQSTEYRSDQVGYQTKIAWREWLSSSGKT
jgi:hypothetical protein